MLGRWIQAMTEAELREFIKNYPRQIKVTLEVGSYGATIYYCGETEQYSALLPVVRDQDRVSYICLLAPQFQIIPRKLVGIINFSGRNVSPEAVPSEFRDLLSHLCRADDH